MVLEVVLVVLEVLLQLLLLQLLLLQLRVLIKLPLVRGFFVFRPLYLHNLCRFVVSRTCILLG